MNLPALKLVVHARCLEIVEDKISLLEKELAQVNEAASNETKSTAGDKHETARAMMHIEREKLSRQLAQVIQQRQLLSKIDPEVSVSKAASGALVQTDSMLLYIATSLGKLNLQDKEVMVISTSSPIGQAIAGVSANERFKFREKVYQVIELA